MSLTDSGTTAAPSSLALAAPFIVSFAVQVVAILLSLLLTDRVGTLLTELGLPDPITPEVDKTHIADIVGWGIDMTASIGAVVAPAVGIALVKPVDDSTPTVILMVVVIVIAIAAFVYAFLQKDATKYMHRIPRVPLSLIALGGLALNAIAAVLIVTTS